jgi:glycosyltransferase involved in cell wall biosynthesis
VISVIVPAHDEAAVIGRLLTGLLADAAPGELDVLVVANGCTDGTERVAAQHGPGVRVLSTADANKFRAMRLADTAAAGFPRFYVDADVELDTRSLRNLAAALEEPGVLAVAPERAWPVAGAPWTVTWYLDVWHRLPVVRAGLFGRGVVGMSEEGYKRLRDLPEVMGDDLAASLAFRDSEQRVLSNATVVVHPPRSLRNLVRIRERALVSTEQLAQEGTFAQAGAAARTSRADMMHLVRPDPVRFGPKVAWFVFVTVLVRRRARRRLKSRDFRTWQRDDSSRRTGAPADG